MEYNKLSLIDEPVTALYMRMLCRNLTITLSSTVTWLCVIFVFGFCDSTVEPLYPVQETDEVPSVDVSRARGSRTKKATRNDVC